VKSAILPVVEMRMGHALIRAEAGRFDGVADADANITACGRASRWTCGETVVIGGVERGGLARGIIAAVIGDRAAIAEDDADLVGHLLGLMKLRRRTSAGSSFISRATRSIIRSITNTPAGRPAPRTGVVEILLVNATSTSSL
jgi:hypothetical protein